jgi:DNA helicase-2/ATP-dependent DNA helicase PcrA
MKQAYAIYGPPGCGKTTKIITMIGDFVKFGYDNNDIALMSHTRAAAKEALERTDMERSDKFSTIHSQCYRMLNLSSSQLVDNKRLVEFSNVIGVPIKNGSIDSEEGIEVGDEFLGILNKARNRLVDPMDEYYNSERPGSLPQFEMFIKGYHDWKRSNGFIDFTDMLERFVARQEEMHFQAKVVFIDEAQDLSALQWRAVRVLTKNADRVIVAGDDDQAIYVWGGADPAGMVQFEEEYQSKRKVLEQSYRIPAKVHTLARSIIDQVEHRVDKVYLPRGEVGRVERYGYLHAVDFKHGEDTLALCRTGAQKKEVEKHFIDMKIPYLVDNGKPGLYQTKTARAIKAFNKVRRGEGLMPAESEVLNSTALPKFRDQFKNRDFKAGIQAGHMRALSIPSWSWEFYRDTDMDIVPTIRLSSIHGSKGREADRVVLHTGMTERTAAGFDKDPDAERRVFYVGVTRARHRLDILEGMNGFPL